MHVFTETLHITIYLLLKVKLVWSYMATQLSIY